MDFKAGFSRSLRQKLFEVMSGVGVLIYKVPDEEVLHLDRSRVASC